MKIGTELIAQERQRQIDVEGFTPEQDKKYLNGELVQAAACYAVNGDYDYPPDKEDYSWPFSAQWWKPSTDRIKNLVRAGALIAAEIDRLQN